MGTLRNNALNWLWLLGILTALSVFTLLFGPSVGATRQSQIPRDKVPLLTETPSSTPTVVPTFTDTPAATPAQTSSATTAPTNTPSPTRTPIPTATSCPIQFSDVPPGSTYYDYVRCLACRGLVSGYPDGTFRPNNVVTRGQALKIDTLAGGIVFPIPPDRQSFEDVPPGSTFWLYIERGYAYPIAGGYPCGTSPSEPCVPPLNLPYFRPNNPASRGQITKIINNTAGWLEPVTGQDFEDVGTGSTFYVFVQRMVVRNIISGYSCGGPGEPCVPPENRPYFRPYNPNTRGQLAKLAARTFLPGCVTP